MAEWLTHVLVAFTAATVLSWRYDAVTAPLVAVAMAGALIPDLIKIWLVVPSDAVEAALGIPFAWNPLHQLGGAVIVILIATTLVQRGTRGLVFVMLSIGTGAHFLMDHFIYRTSGFASTSLWPLTSRRFAADGFYLSYDPEPLLFALPFALTVLGITYLQQRDTTSDSPTPALPPAPSRDPRSDPRHLTDGGWPVEDATDRSDAD